MKITNEKQAGEKETDISDLIKFPVRYESANYTIVDAENTIVADIEYTGALPDDYLTEHEYEQIGLFLENAINSNSGNEPNWREMEITAPAEPVEIFYPTTVDEKVLWTLTNAATEFITEPEKRNERTVRAFLEAKAILEGYGKRTDAERLALLAENEQVGGGEVK